MKAILSIEELRQKIVHPKTRIAMDEVLSCFYSNNLRSAVVMLYSTVVSDLYYKLLDLKNLYEDKGAIAIINEIEKEKKTNPKSSTWESIMPQRCLEKNKIIRTDDVVHYESLQKERNLCAHPVIDDNDDLYRPNSAYVQGLIINMLQGLLCKPSFISKDLFNIFINDIEYVSNSLMDDDKVVKYIEAKYLNKIDNPQEEYLLFKPLWKIVFLLENEECNKNRIVNYKVLLKMMERHKDFFLYQIHTIPADFFTDRSRTELSEKNIMTSRWGLLIQFLNKYPQVQDAILPEFNITLEQIIKENSTLSYIALYNKSNQLEHILTCVKNRQTITNSGILYLNKVILDNYSHEIYQDFTITLYGHACSYDRANWIFNSIIASVIGTFTSDQLRTLLEYMNENGQIYDSYAFPNACRMIKERLDVIDSKFDFTPYEKCAPYLK